MLILEDKLYSCRLLITNGNRKKSLASIVKALRVYRKRTQSLQKQFHGLRRFCRNSTSQLKQIFIKVRIGNVDAFAVFDGGFAIGSKGGDGERHGYPVV